MALLSVAEALGRVLAQAEPLPAEEGPRSAKAKGRVLVSPAYGTPHPAASRRFRDGRLRPARYGRRQRAGAI